MAPKNQWHQWKPRFYWANIYCRDGSSKPTASQLSGYCWLWCSEIRHPRKESGFWKHPFLYCKNSEALIECVLLLVLSHQCQLPFLSTKVLDFQSRIRLYRKLPVFSKEVRLRRFELLLCGPFSIEVKRFLKGMRWFRWVSVLRNSEERKERPFGSLWRTGKLDNILIKMNLL